jgi:Bifunctional DNA primase/polymerase, N-terminal/Primase C terminal 1 (PriCT-1)
MSTMAGREDQQADHQMSHEDSRVPTSARPMPSLTSRDESAFSSAPSNSAGPGVREWTKQAEDSAVALARVNTNLTVSQRTVFIATSRMIRFHVGSGESRTDGFVPVTDGEIAMAAGTTNRTVQHHLKVAEDWGLIEKKHEWSQQRYINPKTGRQEQKPVCQLLIRQKEPGFLAQVRLIATFDPGLGRNAGWGGFRGDNEADERPSRSSAYASPVKKGMSRARVTTKTQGVDDKTKRLDVAPQPNASEEVPSCRTNKLPRRGGDRSKGGNRQKKWGNIPTGASIMLCAALGYAERGWPVFPVHSFAENRCSCAKGDQCLRPGKHPRTQSGLNAATIDRARICRWWSEHPDDNIGIATGPANLVVIDIDERHGGLDSWAALEAEIGSNLCDTATVLTGGGGEHRYFEAPDEIIVPSSTGQVGIGIDVRAHGGYVIAPPSTHASGTRYEWFEGTDGIPIPLPDRLLELLTSPVTDVEDARLSELPSSGGAIPTGQRNDVLFREACSLRGRGASQENIYASLRLMNQQRCSPPLSDDELRGIARSAARYRPNGMS